MKNSKVTIAIPYYDSPIYLLRKCIDSCIKQTYDNTEILVLIDGSPKDVSNVIDAYEKKFKNISFIVSKKNRGVSFQRNLAIKKSTGKYIQFVDSDDYIDSEMVEKMVEKMELDNCDITICGVSGAIHECEDGIFDAKTFFSFPSRFCQIQYTNFSWNKLFRVSLLKEKNTKFDENIKLGEDAVFCQEYYKYIKYIGCISERPYHYVKQESSLTQNYDPDFYKYEKAVIESIEANFHRYNLNEQETRYLQYWHYRKVFMVFDYYFNAFNSGIITKTELIKNYHKIKEDELFRVDTNNIKKNSYFSTAERHTAKALNGSPINIMRVISATHGKRTIIKTFISK